MLGCAVESLAKLAVFLWEGVVDDTCTTLAFDSEPDEDSDRWQVVFNEVICAIKWIYPNDSVFGIEGFEGLYWALNLI